MPIPLIESAAHIASCTLALFTIHTTNNKYGVKLLLRQSAFSRRYDVCVHYARPNVYQVDQTGVAKAEGEAASKTLPDKHRVLQEKAERGINLMEAAARTKAELVEANKTELVEAIKAELVEANVEDVLAQLTEQIRVFRANIIDPSP